MKTFIVNLMLLSATFAAHSHGAGDPVKGKDLSQFCSGCHGEFGIAPIASNPNLAGQNAKYLEYALKAYRDGKRNGGMAVIMRPNASNLTDQDIADLAAFFASQPGKGAQE